MKQLVLVLILVLGATTQARADEQPFVMRRPQPLWQPVSLLGGGAVVGGIGVLFMLRADAQYDDYNAAIASECAEGGCNPEEIPAYITDLRDSAGTSEAIGLTSMVLGGIGVVGGLVWLMIDYPRPVPVPVRVDGAPGQISLVVEGQF